MSTLIDTPFPSTFTLYYHRLEEKKWNLESFTKVGTFRTVRDYLVVSEELSLNAFSDGMFFLFRDPIPPLWENFNNVYGGCYSFKSPKASAGQAFDAYAIAFMLGQTVYNASNKINGISISPKAVHNSIKHNIIKIWNSSFKEFNDPKDLRELHPDVTHEGVVYTRSPDKKM